MGRRRQLSPRLPAPLAPLAALLGLAWPALAVGQPTTTPSPACPVQRCSTVNPAAGAIFFEVSSGSGAPDQDLVDRLATESEQPCAEVSSYDVDFTPGHFTCTRCDAHSCEGCGLLCDLASCVGEFYEQACLCGASDQPPSKLLCDPTCEEGPCATQDAQCNTPEQRCSPWWWCGAPPPRASFLLQRSGSGSGLGSRRAGARGQGGGGNSATLALATGLRRWKQRAAALGGGRTRQRALRAAGGAPRGPEVGRLAFQNGRFVCRSAALPPKTRDPGTMLWVERGYLVLDQSTCEGSLFDNKCYCWDNVKYLRGEEDPLTSGLQCDAGCKFGPCEGLTCADRPPPKLVVRSTQEVTKQWQRSRKCYSVAGGLASWAPASGCAPMPADGDLPDVYRFKAALKGASESFQILQAEGSICETYTEVPSVPCGSVFLFGPSEQGNATYFPAATRAAAEFTLQGKAGATYEITLDLRCQNRRWLVAWRPADADPGAASTAKLGLCDEDMDA